MKEYFYLSSPPSNKVVQIHSDYFLDIGYRRQNQNRLYRIFGSGMSKTQPKNNSRDPFPSG